jgi:serine/threonine protein kinase
MIEMLLAHVERTPPDVRALRPEVPVAIADLISRLLSKHPDDRPASAEEVIVAIDALSPQTLSRSLCSSEGIPRPSRSHRARWARTTAVLAVPVVVLGTLLGFGQGIFSSAGDSTEVVLASHEMSGEMPSATSNSGSEASDSLALAENRGVAIPRITDPVEPIIPVPAEKASETSANATPSPSPGSGTENASSSGRSGWGGGGRSPFSFFGLPVFGAPPLMMKQNTGLPVGMPFPFGMSFPRKPPTPPSSGKTQSGHHNHHPH